ncbi:siderophore ABC transporter substrate-binding protein [Brevibacillus dissolubilis]|uniref:siderophore ABC transporter substrate-binding protein n=1 Tax=Brevibacillus dissolubilis TaxID=1844116 RepID=UPI0011162E73|nr:siderophore ABC transporter substrate-binding protein [Brevibacillus dissolubilis]
MKAKLSMILMTVFFAVIVAACGQATSEVNSNQAEAPKAAESTQAPEEITVKHQLGETKVKKNPAKVVVFDYGVLDTMEKLGVEPIALPKDSVPSYLSKYEDAKYENAGGIKEPDFEKLNSLQPDLIIISGRQQESYEELSKIAPTVFMAVDTKKYMESFTENAKTLGQIFGKEDVVEKELAAINETIKGLKEKATAGGKNGLIILANGGKISAYGAGSRFGIIHDVFGVTPVDKNIEVSTHGQSISFEYIVEKDPDYLFVIDRDAVVEGKSAAKALIENELVKGTKAFKNGTIVYLDPNYWYLSGGGLISVAEMTKEIDNVVK